MRILHQDFRTLIPRVESVHLFSRVIFLLGIVAYLIFGPLAKVNFQPLLVIFGATIALTGSSWLFSHFRRGEVSNLYFLSIIFDTLLIAAMTRYTGGAASDFYVFYFLTVSVGAYVLSPLATIIFAGLITALYLGGNITILSMAGPLGMVIRITLIWFYALMVNYISEYFRRSETRLLKVFNTLNRRTS
jgi:hypothetical protein